jgi:hypothetical protein
MIYRGGLLKPDEVLDADTASQVEGILSLGDDFAGWIAGFDQRGAVPANGISCAAAEADHNCNTLESLFMGGNIRNYMFWGSVCDSVSHRFRHHRA